MNHRSRFRQKVRTARAIVTDKNMTDDEKVNAFSELHIDLRHENAPDWQIMKDPTVNSWFRRLFATEEAVNG